MPANTTPPLPPLSAKTGPGRTKKRSGPVPAWGLKVASALMTFAVFGTGLGYASTHLYTTNAPLQPAAIAATSTSTSSTTATPAATTATTTLTSAIRTTTRTAVTKTASS